MADWSPNNYNSSDSEDDESGYDFKGREAIIFVLDAILFNTTYRFEEATSLLRNALISGLLVKDKDLIGIVFANTKESPPPKDPEALKNIVVPESCAIFLPVRQLTTSSVEYYLNFMEEHYFDFAKTYGVGSCRLANMIRLCGNMFQQCGMKLSHQTIVYFTDVSAPEYPGTQEFHRSLHKAKDLERQGTEFTLIPMNEIFDFDPFYKEFLSLASGISMEDFEPTLPAISRDMIAERKLKLSGKKRSLGQLMWKLGNGLEISVKFYNFFQRSLYPQKVLLKRDTNSVVTVKIMNTIEERYPDPDNPTTLRCLLPSDKSYEITCGNETLKLTEDKMLEAKYPYKPMIQLIGFTDRINLTLTKFLRPHLFLYPDDARIEGSTGLFTALWQRCLSTDKICLCIMIPRRKSKPSYVALVPMAIDEYPKTDAHLHMIADGFKVVHLRQSEDENEFNFWNDGVPRSSEGELLFSKIIKKLKLKYTPSNIKDPALEMIHARLLALSLDIPTVGDGQFQMPDIEKQDQRIEQYMDDFKSLFGEDLVAEKRRARSPAMRSVAKIAKLSDENVNTTSVKELFLSGSLEVLSKDQMMNFLKSINIKFTKSMTKPKLISLIEEYCRSFG